MSDKRSFTITSATTSTGRVKGETNIGGRFLSKTPSGAAKKMATQICGKSKIKGRCVLHIELKETTQGSSGKTYKYKVTRVYDPVTVEYKNGMEITREYRIEIKSMN
jgi:hypothetical protein